MNASQHRVSLGALALLMCLALPAGLLSLFAESTTGEQVDQSELIVVARVASLQAIPDPQRTAVEFAVSDVIWGKAQPRSLNVVINGRTPLQVGDSVVAIAAHRPVDLLGVLKLSKDPRSLAWQVVSPVSGMSAQGLSGGGPQDPISLALVRMFGEMLLEGRVPSEDKRKQYLQIIVRDRKSDV